MHWEVEYIQYIYYTYIYSFRRRNGNRIVEDILLKKKPFSNFSTNYCIILRWRPKIQDNAKEIPSTYIQQFTYMHYMLKQRIRALIYYETGNWVSGNPKISMECPENSGYHGEVF